MAESAIMKSLNGRKVYDEDARKEMENIKNAAPGLVFDTVADMEAYIAENADTLKVGQDLFIRAADVPDYWWDGTAAVPVETELGEVKKEIAELSEAIAEQGKTIPKVFQWANAELPFTESEISGVVSGGGFVTNPTNFADGKTYFRYHAGASYGFLWTNPNQQKGAVTLTVLSWKQYDKESTGNSSSMYFIYADGTQEIIRPQNGVVGKFVSNADKTLTQIKGNYDIENWILLDMDVLSIVADYPVPSGGTITADSLEPAEDDIPKIFFGGALQQTKDEAVVPFRYISKTEDILGYAEIKAQGNSSMSYPKKNQTVKLYKDAECTEKLKVDFKGWGKQSKHCYKANWIDLTHARNVVSARLWGDVVKSRDNYAELPELLRTSPNQGAVDGFPVKVYAAGVYQGRYTLNIPKDAWMANMDDELDNHCILCGENYVSGCFRALANINESDWTDEVHDVVPASIKNRWNEVISFVMNSTDEEFKANLGNYFYVDSLIDYYLFGLASCDLDGFGKNQIFMTYDGQRWIASAYDKDSTWGLYWNGSKFVSATYTREEYEDMISGREGNLLYMRLEQLFYTELQNRWAELKNGALSIENIINRFERFTDIAPAELVKEDYASTTGGGAFTGIPSKDTNNIQQIRAFALARQAWTDEYVTGLTPEEAVPCTGITLDADTLTFTSAGTQTLTATVTPDNTTDIVVWESDDTSVCTVSGGVVTAKANGNATITVTCGAYSDTCAVAVSGIEEEGTETVLPTGYTAVDYIQSDGNQYIDTGVSGGTNAAWEIKMNALGSYAVNYEMYIAGDRNGTIPNLYCNSTQIASNNATGTSNNLIPLGGSDNVYEYRGTKAVYVNGTAYDIINDPTGNGWGTSTWYVFNSHGEPNLKSSMRLYYFKMWTDGVLVRDFVPAVRESDNVAGLYDLSNDVFYTNAGTGAFMTPDNITEDTAELLYSMPETKTFNGTSDYIDTGLPLMSKARNMTICIDCDFTSGVAHESAIFHCMTESGSYPGIALAMSSALTYAVQQQSDRMYGIPTGRRKVVIKYVMGCQNVVMYSDNGATQTIKGNGAYMATDKNLLIGCYQTDDGTKGRYWTGTIYDFKVYDGNLSDDEITAYLNS